MCIRLIYVSIGVVYITCIFHIEVVWVGDVTCIVVTFPILQHFTSLLHESL